MNAGNSFSADDIIKGGDVLASLTPPAKLAVIGDPVAHSRSPQFHNAALAAAGIDGQYIRIQASPEQFEETLRALPGRGFLGANITIPHKASALAAVDVADGHAQRAGGVNTVLIDGGKLFGFSTDGPGLVRALREEFYIDLRDLRVMILGAGGGAGRAIAAQCAEERCERLVLVNRTVEKAKALAEELRPSFVGERLEGPVDRLVASEWTEKALRGHLEYVDLVINASSVGMRRSDPPALPATLLHPSLMIYDTVYAAERTRLVDEALSAGARAANGLSMLLHQGALAYEIWFDRPAPLEVMRKALLEAAG